MSGLLSFHGRIPRLAYLKVEIGLYAAIYFAGFMLVIGMMGLHADLPSRDIPSFFPRFIVPQPVAIVAVIIGAITLVAGLWVGTAVEVRRFHDIGVTGWCVLVGLVFVWVVPDPANWPGTLPSLGNILWDIGLLLLPGTAGPNKYDGQIASTTLDRVF